MDIIFKHTLKSISRNLVQSVIIVGTMIIITACIFFMLSCTDLFSRNADIWAEAACANSDVYSNFYTDRKKVNELISANPDYVDSVLFATVSTASVMMDDDTKNAEIVACNTNECLYYLNASTLNIKKNTTEHPSVVIPENFATKYGLTSGDTIDISYKFPASDKLLNTFFITQVVDNGVMFYSQDTFRIMVDEEELGLLQSCNRVYLYLNSPDAFMADGKTQAQYYCDYLNEASTGISSFSVSSTTEYKDESLSGTQDTLNLVIAIIILMMFFILFYSYTIVARNRAQEIIIFKAAGATPFQTVLIMLLEVAAYAVIGCGIGLAVGKLFTDYVSSQVFISTASLLTYAPWKYAATYFLGIAAGLLSCLFPAIRIAKRSVRHLMSGNTRITKPMPLPVLIAALVVLAVFITLVFTTDFAVISLIGTATAGCVCIIGATPYLLKGACFLVNKIKRVGAGKLAAYGMPNNAGIMTITSMLAILITFVWMGSSMINVIQVTQTSPYDRYTADFTVISSTRNYTVTDTQSLLDDYLSLDGITGGCAYSYFPTTALNGKTANDGNATPLVHAIKRGADIRYFTTDWSESMIDAFNAEEHPIVISYQLSCVYGLKLGDSVKLTTTSGNLQELTVVGIEHAYASSAPFAIMKEADAVRHGTNVVVGQKKWFLTGDSNKFSQIRAKIDTPTETFYKTDTYYSDNYSISKVQTMLNVILYFFYFIAALGFINLLIVTVVDRRREMTIFRFTGMTTTDAFKMTATESCVSVITGWALGMTFAVIIAQMQPIFASMMNKYATFSRFPLEMCLISVSVAALVLLLWSASPALLAGRMKNYLDFHNTRQ